MSNLVNLIMAAVLSFFPADDTAKEQTTSTQTVKAIMTTDLKTEAVVPTIRFEAGKC